MTPLAIAACAAPVSEPEESTFAGHSSIYYAVDGVARCDAAGDLSGTAYTGDCPDCDFAFDVTSVITRDDGVDCRDYATNMTFLGQDPLGLHDMALLHADANGTWPEKHYNVLYSSYYRYNAASDNYWGYHHEAFDSYYAYYSTLYEDLGAYSPEYLDPMITFSQNQDSIAWTWSTGGQYDTYVYSQASWWDYYYCGLDPDYLTVPSRTGEKATGTLPCAVDTIDLWTFDTQGGQVEVSATPTSATTAASLQLLLSTPDECFALDASRQWACDYPGTYGYGCPAESISRLTNGRYQIAIANDGDCTGTDVTYELDVRTATGAANLVQIADDADLHATISHSWERRYTLTGIIH